MIWLDPKQIRSKIIGPNRHLRGTVGGDWDIRQCVPLYKTAKYRAVIDHFAEGLRWQDTELFSNLYRHRLKHGECVRGASTLDELALRYEQQVDTIFEAMRNEGFQAIGSLPLLLRGRTGELFIGNQGNHRLAMAHVLGLDKFAGEVVCRHP